MKMNHHTDLIADIQVDGRCGASEPRADLLRCLWKDYWGKRHHTAQGLQHISFYLTVIHSSEQPLRMLNCSN